MTKQLDSDLLLQIQKELWDVVNSHIEPQEVQKVFALSGSMMKIAVQLYTVVLEDEEIENILSVVKSDIPTIRKTMTEKMGKRVLH
jgi:hypothetical protein|tara:strand:+ start:692 stop:949 length:258 start_codon:yes stop_codon:yes gene_type:complete